MTYLETFSKNTLRQLASRVNILVKLFKIIIFYHLLKTNDKDLRTTLVGRLIHFINYFTIIKY